ncbi:alpha-E domain-containing protein [Bordetella sp. FB-8]|uniref:alpha-E domain-containing protein n=1 Tax=Bordetella sp. FB-8 TaxID=1159870 RepID=UPI00036FAD05|nr:alpha-E domain-containing protein [Bordetella sp. FB-8]
MLSRTADNLFWMTRHIERADNTSRMLNVNLQMALLPQDAHTLENSWRAVLRICELQSVYAARHPAITPRDVMHYMVRDAQNPSSIYSCLRAARENARAVRGSLTTEVWETYNSTWLGLLGHLESGLPERNPVEFFDWVKFRSHLARGVTLATMQIDEELYFMRLGLNLERADNTARMLDVKFHERDDDIPAERGIDPGTYGEFYRWSALLSALAGLEIYRKIYRDVIAPDRVAELLILREDMPRSLLNSVKILFHTLSIVAGDRSAETVRRTGMMRAELEYGRIEDIMRGGLHRFLERFLARINDLGTRIGHDFLMSVSN